MGRRALPALLVALAAGAALAPPASAGSTTIGQSDCYCVGVGLGADGSVYTGDPSRARLLRLRSPDGALLGAWTDLGGTGARPGSSAVAPDGNMVVVDGTRGVIVVTPSGQFVRRITSDPAGDVAVDAAGTAYLADGQPWVETVPATGGPTQRLDDPAYGWQEVVGVGYDAVTGHVFAVDRAAGQVTELRPDGGVVRSFGQGHLTDPTDVAVAPDGSAYVTEGGNTQEIKKFGPAGNEVGRKSFAGTASSLTTIAGGDHTLVFPIGAGLRVLDLDHPEIRASPGYQWLLAGAHVHFAASATADFSTIEHYRWDFDGDGVDDLDTGTRGEADYSYLTPGEYRTGVTAIAADGARNTERSTITVQPAGVVLSSSPVVALTGTPVTLFADTNNVPGSPLTEVRWDLDGNGSYETDGGTSQTLRTTFATAGTHTVGARLVRGGGAVDDGQAPVVVHAKPPAGPVGVSVDGGDRFTNDPHVTLDVTWPAGADRLTAANDGGFQGARALPVAEHVAFTLADDGPERLPKTVYVRFDAGAQTFQDDIVLDRTDPAIQSASVAPAAPAPAGAAAVRTHRYRVRIRASDRTSGVASVQFAVRRSKPAKRVRYHRSLSVRSTARPVYVRVRDRAGNDSRWRRLIRGAR